jgi:ribonuclease HII
MIMRNMQVEWTIGVDEAGRGPLAGPVAVGAVCVATDFNWDMFPGLTDSKQLSEKKREELFYIARDMQNENLLRFAVAQVGPGVIDRLGITKAIAIGVKRSLGRLEVQPEETVVKLDGLLKAPVWYAHQETIIKGDVKEKVISLASVLAKVTRDRYMTRMAARHNKYGFERHKGYGTKEHQAALMAHAPCTLHRMSFIGRFV